MVVVINGQDVQDANISRVVIQNDKERSNKKTTKAESGIS